MFGNYSESFEPSGSGYGAALDRFGNALPSETAQGHEFGVKFLSPDNRVTTTLSCFDITRQNVASADPDPAFPFASVAAGEQNSTGFEFEIMGEVLPNLTLQASYAYIDAAYTRDNTIRSGNHLFGVPEHGASFWARYDFEGGALDGFGVGAGLRYVGERLSGSLIIFIEDIARWENGDILFPKDAPEQIDIQPEQVDLWIQSALDTYPQVEHVEVIEYPDAGHIPATVPTLISHIETEDGVHKHFLIGVHPDTDQLTGATVLEDGIWVTLVFFHFSLLIPFGFEGVCWSTLFAFVSVVTGLVLWWPKAAWRHWKNALRFPTGWRGKTQQLRLHNAAGIYLLIRMTVALFTGLYIVKAHWFDPAFSLFSEDRSVPFEMEEESEHDHDHEHVPPKVTPGEALAIARRDHPVLILRQIMPAVEAGKPHFVSLMPQGWDPRKGHTQLWIDSETGSLLSGWKGEEASGLETPKSSAVAWYEDMGLGRFGEFLVFLSGLSLPILYVSGILLWRKRVGGRKRKSEG